MIRQAKSNHRDSAAPSCFNANRAGALGPVSRNQELATKDPAQFFEKLKSKLHNVQLEREIAKLSNQLYSAAIEGNEEEVKMLLERKDIQINEADCNGDKALIKSSARGHETIVALLLGKEGTCQSGGCGLEKI